MEPLDAALLGDVHPCNRPQSVTDREEDEEDYKDEED
jgi:hypothetical protein